MSSFGTAVQDVTEPVAAEMSANNQKAAKTTDAVQAEAKQPKKKSGLAGINKGKVKMPRRVIVYGVDGIGKSTLASHAPNPIFVSTEDGLGDVDCESFPVAKSWLEVKQHLAALCNEKHGYRTLVVDSLDWLERLVWDEVCREKGVSQIDEIGYGKGYSAAIALWQDFLKALDHLRNVKKMGIILIAHAKIVKFENPEGENYDQYSLALHKLASPILREWADEVLFASYKVYTKTVEGDFGKETTKAIGGNERVMRTREKPFCYAKNRADLPDEIPMTWADYAKCLPK